MKHIAFWAALLSFLIFLITVFAGGASFPGYNHTSQFISELGATGAPYSQAVSWLGFFPAGVLLMIVSVAAFLTLPRTRKWQGGEHLFMLGVVCWAIGATALLLMNPDFAYVGLAQRTIELCMYVWLLSCAWYYRGSQVTMRQVA